MSIRDNCPKGGAGGRNGICTNVIGCEGNFHVCDHERDCHFACTKPDDSKEKQKGAKHRRPKY